MPKHEFVSSPEVMETRLTANPGKAVVLGLDLGTNCGYSIAYHKLGDPVDPPNLSLLSGQWDLSAGPYDSGAIRFVRLRQFLAVVKPDLVCYEMVRNTPAEKVTKYNAAALLARAVTAAQLFGAFQSHVCAWCEEFNVPCTSFTIQAIKKRATGKGNAGKPDMIAAANRTFGLELDPEGYESSGVDNVADSAWVCLMALEQYANGLQLSEEA